MNKTLLLASLLLLSACNPHSERTKAWYMEHTAEREARVLECKNDAAQAVTADCRNALDAAAQITVFGNGKPYSIDITPKRNKAPDSGQDAESGKKVPDYKIDITPKRPPASSAGADKPTQ